ncbi:MAG: PH domain-containing protein [Candidatus Methanomethylophilaceae archaeon]|nr:PH domain-containing protein [Candidatus Methanomethylophilaceae archaeon]MDY5872431.1 PH domain-containing protein [Candidatus Methanomethylophilaceae archaeon]
MTELEYKMLVPASKKSMYLGNAILIVALAAMAAAAYYFLKDNMPVIAGILACVAVCVVYLLVRPILYYRFYRYAITDDRIDVRQGVIIRTHTVVPIERLHQVEVVRGPINSIFGLSNVKVTTAGGVADIKFLEQAVAESIVDELNTVINRIIRDRNAHA